MLGGGDGVGWEDSGMVGFLVGMGSAYDHEPDHPVSILVNRTGLNADIPPSSSFSHVPSQAVAVH